MCALVCAVVTGCAALPTSAPYSRDIIDGAAASLTNERDKLCLTTCLSISIAPSWTRWWMLDQGPFLRVSGRTRSGPSDQGWRRRRSPGFDFRVERGRSFYTRGSRGSSGQLCYASPTDGRSIRYHYRALCGTGAGFRSFPPRFKAKSRSGLQSGNRATGHRGHF